MISSISSTGGSSSYIAQMQAKLFKAMDTSGDGKIDKSELTSAYESAGASSSNVDSIISGLDTDDDAAISQLEFESGLSQLQQQMKANRTEEESSSDKDTEMFSKIDTNGDGTVSSDELATFKAQGPEGGPTTEEMLSQLDTDGSGDVSQSEFTSGMEQMRQNRRTEEESSSDKDTEMFSKIDTNGDGTVSSDELAAFKAQGPEGGPTTEEMLSQLDTDGSGDVSQSEFTSGMESMRANAPQGPPPGGPPPDASASSTASSTTTTASSSSTSDTTSSDTSYDLNQLLSIAMQTYMKNLGFQAQSSSTLSAVSSYA